MQNVDGGGRHRHYRLVRKIHHYDKDMRDTFVEELGLPEPNLSVACVGGSQA